MNNKYGIFTISLMAIPLLQLFSNTLKTLLIGEDGKNRIMNNHVSHAFSDYYFANTLGLKQQSPIIKSDLGCGVGVVAVALFTSWVEDNSLFDLPGEALLPLSDSFIVFLHKLLSRKDCFETAEKAVIQILQQKTSLQQSFDSQIQVNPLH